MLSKYVPPLLADDVAGLLADWRWLDKSHQSLLFLRFFFLFPLFPLSKSHQSAIICQLMFSGKSHDVDGCDIAPTIK